jgi:hypothetical protein
MPRSGRFTPGKHPVPIVQDVGWVPGPVWTGAEYLAPAGMQSPDLPARSQSLYRLRNRANNCRVKLNYITIKFRFRSSYYNIYKYVTNVMSLCLGFYSRKSTCFGHFNYLFKNIRTEHFKHAA